jgi:predicted patatin/cPLA2 family phospholipase
VTEPPHPVLQALHDPQPGQRLALAIEGGGMRGVVSAAMTAVIEREGLLDRFAIVAGASAGALNGAALVAGVADGCTRAYADAFAGRLFINPARLLLGRPVIDVEAIIAYQSDADLDADRHRRAAASEIELHCVATEIATASAVDLTGLRTIPTLHEALLASSRLPWIGGEPVQLSDGRRFLDGGLVEPVPIDTAIRAGATHVLALLTRPRGAAVPPVGGGLADRLVERRLRALNPALVDAYRARPAGYGATIDRIAAPPAAAGPHVLGVFLPEGSPVPSRLERDPQRLRAAAALARAAAERALLG